ncbi:uncharacterized protein JCM10292_007720 [Rhodotorula paludigena]|uniref:uncharacterized protein n=1 Tax=Rhodotorula paludigena TaxID=86838 RepID=UPI00317434FD
MAPKTPIVEPIQGSNSASSSSSSSSEPIHPSPVVDEGPSDSSIPSSQASSFARPGTQDALRGQGNSAAPSESISRESYAPVPRSQERDAAEHAKKELDWQAEEEARRPENASGDDDFRMTEAKSATGEPQPGQPKLDRSSDANLVEAGTTMAGDAGADSGIDEAQHGRDVAKRAKEVPKKPKL